jgi:hypothetical protein
MEKKSKKEKRPRGTNLAQSLFRPRPIPGYNPKGYVLSPLTPLTCGTHMSGTPPTSGRSPSPARRSSVVDLVPRLDALTPPPSLCAYLTPFDSSLDSLSSLSQRSSRADAIHRRDPPNLRASSVNFDVAGEHRFLPLLLASSPPPSASPWPLGLV